MKSSISNAKTLSKNIIQITLMILSGIAVLLPFLPGEVSAQELPNFDVLSSQEDQNNYVSDQIIVKTPQAVPIVFKQGNIKFKSKTVAKMLRKRLHDINDGEVIYSDSELGYELIEIPEGKDVEDMIERYSKYSLVEYAEPNYIAQIDWTPTDPYYSYQWNFDQINMEGAWDIDINQPSHGGDPGIVVAVLDTGVAYENYDNYLQAPDLASTNFVPGYDFINNDAHANDDHAHGTHVAGTIAQSTGNGQGVAGVAFNTTIMPVKVLSTYGTGTYQQIADGIRYAADNGADIINMSLGGASPSTTMRNALSYAYDKGVTIICAAGNSYQKGNYASYPAAYDDYCIAVGAVRYDRTHSYYSTTGSYLDIAAPGGDLNVDQNRDGQSDGILQQTINPWSKNPRSFDYYFFQGTSMAAPHVTGVAALILAQHPDWTPQEVRHALESTAIDIGSPGKDNLYGWGLLNAPAAIGQLTAPSLVSPIDRETIPGEDIAFQWNGSGVATRYRLEVNTNPNWNEATRHFYAETTNTFQVVSGFPNDPSNGVTYYWRVWAGDESRWCDDEEVNENSRSFTNLGKPHAPDLVSPQDGITIGGESINFEWNQSVGAIKYYLIVNTQPEWDTGIVKFSGDIGDVNQYQDTGYLNDGTTYYWRIWAGNDAGWCSPAEADTNVRSFINVEIPPAPALTYPINIETVSGQAIDFQWEEIPSATNYRVEINSDPNWGNSTIHFVGEANATSLTVDQFPDDPQGQTYYWRVWAGNIAGWTPAEEVNVNSESFVNMGVPDSPGLIYPDDDSILSGEAVDFQWNPVEWATKYKLEINSGSDWGNETLKFKGEIGNATSYFDTGYTNDGTTYYWRVWAGNDGGWSNDANTTANGHSFINIDKPPAPILSSPIFGVAEGTSVTFQWDDSFTASNYRLEVNSDPNWRESTRLFIGETSETSKVVGVFPNDPRGTTYYWRVWAGNIAGWCSDGNATANSQSFVNMGIPSAPVPISPEDNAGVSGTSIAFKWNESVGATKYRLVINTDPIWSAGTIKFSGEVGNITEFVDRGYIDDRTTYYWRIWAGNEAGWCTDAEAEADTWKFTNTATKYRLEINSDPNWGEETRFFYEETFNTLQEVTGFPNNPEGTTYYWRVWAWNEAGWSPDEEATAKSRKLLNLGKPSAPTLVSPSDTLVPGSSVTYSWNPARGADQYDLEVNTDPNFSTSSIKFKGNVGDVTQYTDTGYADDGTTYYWRVWSGNLAGYCETDSITANSKSFVNLDIPEAPELVSPINNRPISGNSIEFEWNKSTGATKYRIEVNSDPNWNPGTRHHYQETTDTSSIVAAFPDRIPGTTYYWRVWAGNVIGWCSDDSANAKSQSFINLGRPAAPILVSPSDRTLVSGSSIHFKWNESEGATYYRLEINSDPEWDAATVKFKGDVGTNNEYIDTGYTDSGIGYYWRVWAGNDAGLSPDENVNTNRNTFTNVGIPAAPQLTSPEDNASITGTSITFKWRSVPIATDYRLEVNGDSNWSQDSRIVYTEIANTTYTATGFPNDFLGKPYYWRVWAGTIAGWCSDDEANANSQCFVNIGVPIAPVLISPQNSSIVSGSSITYQWTTSEWACKYRLEVNTDPDWGTDTIKFKGNIGDFTQYLDTGYSNDGTIYYWRVWAGNSAGWCTDEDANTNSVSFTNLGAPAASTLLSPSDQAIIPGMTITFQWQASSSATKYKLEVNTDPTWNPINRHFYQETENLYCKVSEFTNNKTEGTIYYWRVLAGNEAGWCTDDEANIQSRSFTNLGIPDAPSLISPQNEAQILEDNIIFIWNSSPGSTKYLLEVNSDPDWNLATRHFYEEVADISHTISDFPNQTCTYYWRVLAGNNAGWCCDAQANFNRRSFTIVAKPAAPILVSPHEGSTVSGSLIEFEWNAVDDALRYRIEVNRNANWDSGTRLFYSEVCNTTQTINGFPNNPIAGSIYYWRVWAVNAAGWSLDTETNANSRSFVNFAAPSVPSLTSPVDSIMVPGNVVTYQWSPSIGATQYRLEVNTNSGWASETRKYYGVFSSNITQHIDMDYLNDGTVYYWRVWAGNEAGWTSDEAVNTGSRHFSNLGIPEAPTLLSPANHNSVSGSSIGFKWTSSLGATEYKLEINADPNWGNDTVHYTGTTSELSQTVADFPDDPTGGTTYYWRVWAKNAAGWSPEAEVNTKSFNFTNIGKPDAPGLKTPENGAGVSGTSITFEWNPAPFATNYRLEVNTDPNWNEETRHFYSEIQGTTQVVTGFPNSSDTSTTYYWRVWATNDAGWCSDDAADANSRSLINVNLPTAPQLTMPSNGASVSGITITFEWNSSPLAKNYRLEVNSDPTWNEETRHYYSEIDTTSKNVSGFPNEANGTRYYWRVWAGNLLGWTPDAEVNAASRSFVNVRPPSAPNLSSPYDGVTIDGSSILFRWNRSQSATKYMIEINSVSSWAGDSILFKGNVGDVTQYECAGFPNDGTTFYWRVWAGSDAGWSSITEVNAHSRNFLNLGIPTAPTLISPIGHSVVAGSSIMFQWNTAVAATKYRLEVNSDPNWNESSRIFYKEITDTSREVSGFPNNPISAKNYYWRVWSGNAAGWCSDTMVQANRQSFVNLGTPAAPTLKAPDNGGLAPGTAVSYQWDVSLGATQYYLEINSSPNWSASTVKFSDYVGGGLSYTDIDYPNNGQTYYWRVFAGNTAGWCTVAEADTNKQLFTNIGRPSAPDLVAPDDDAVISGDTITFEW